MIADGQRHLGQGAAFGAHQGRDHGTLRHRREDGRVRKPLHVEGDARQLAGFPVIAEGREERLAREALEGSADLADVHAPHVFALGGAQLHGSDALERRLSGLALRAVDGGERHVLLERASRARSLEGQQELVAVAGGVADHEADDVLAWPLLGLLEGAARDAFNRRGREVTRITCVKRRGVGRLVDEVEARAELILLVE